jgi:ferric-dicitrate binding protein FerR (iron transport regulator)
MAVAEPNELMQRIARVGASIDPDLSDRDVERLVEGARRRRRRRTIWRVGLSAVGAGVAAAVVAMGPWARQVPVGGATARAPAAAVPLRLSDGSVATPLDDASALVVREDATERVAIDLVRGRGRFEVAPRPERLFSVHAGDVVVTVIGTVFSVERVADRIGVTVSRGKVLVEVGRRITDAGGRRERVVSAAGRGADGGCGRTAGVPFGAGPCSAGRQEGEAEDRPRGERRLRGGDGETYAASGPCARDGGVAARRG